MVTAVSGADDLTQGWGGGGVSAVDPGGCSDLFRWFWAAAFMFSVEASSGQSLVVAWRLFQSFLKLLDPTSRGQTCGRRVATVWW